MKQNRHRKILIFIGILVITSVACSCGALNSIRDRLPVGLNDLNPDGIATAVAEQIPQLTQTVGDLLEEGGDQLQGGDEALPPAEADQTFGDLESSYAGLESYRTRIVVTVDGQDENGNPVKESMTMNQEANKAQDAYHMVMQQEGASTGTPQSFEIYTIGDSFYMLDPNNEMGMDTPCFAMTGSSMGDEMDSFEMLSPDEIFDGIESGDLIQRGETVNGIKTDHYRLKNVAMDGTTMMTESGDIWIAQNGGFIVRFVGEGEGEAGLFGNNTTVNGKMHWEFDLLDVNQVNEITLPDVCVQAEAEGLGSLPVPPSASDVSQFGPMMTFNSSDAPNVVADFYRQELAAAGYELTEESELGGMFMYTFTKDGQPLNVIITPGEGSGSTVVLTTEDF